MTRKEIIDGNKIIADFLGYEYVPFNNGLGIKPGWWNPKTPQILKRNLRVPEKVSDEFYLGRSANDLKFHSDWNKFMRACKKWDRLNESPIPIAGRKSLRSVEREYVVLCECLDNTVTLYDILSAFEPLVKCVSWYNKVTKGN